MAEFLSYIGSNQIITGIVSLSGIASFLMTIWLAIKTSNINKTIKRINAAKNFNAKRDEFGRIFEGHRRSIVDDKNHTQIIISEIDSVLQKYRYQFRDIFTLRDYWLVWRFEHELKKSIYNIDFHKVAIYLAELNGRLSKEEDSNIV